GGTRGKRSDSRPVAERSTDETIAPNPRRNVRRRSGFGGFSAGSGHNRGMTTRSLPWILLLPVLALASCAGPGTSGRASHGRDEWGHRPGPQGFTTVVLDAGHGGHDAGAVSRWTGRREK